MAAFICIGWHLLEDCDAVSYTHQMCIRDRRSVAHGKVCVSVRGPGLTSLFYGKNKNINSLFHIEEKSDNILGMKKSLQVTQICEAQP